MVNRRSSRIVGTSRSNSHQSRNQSMNHRRPISASFYPGGQNAAGEGTSGPSLEERIRKMEESHNEILQLLRETRQPALPQREEVFLPRDPPGLEEVQPEHLQAEIPLPPPRRHSQSHQNNEVADTASSTHPNLLEDLGQAHVAEFPRNALRHELRRLVGLAEPAAAVQQSPNRRLRASRRATRAGRARVSRVSGGPASGPNRRTARAEGGPEAGRRRAGGGPKAGRRVAGGPNRAPRGLACRARGSAAGGGGGGRPAVKLSVSKIQTQRHQIRLNPSPNESKSRTQSAVGRFKPQFELPNGFQMGRAYSRIERLDETNPTSPRSLNSDIIKTSKCPSNEPSFLQEGGPKAIGEEKKKKKKRREEGKEGRNSSSTTAGFPSDAGILSEFQERKKLCPTPK
ncbi:hypothetical protein M5K25_006847 [Dendrobium thyrsiflorum]|uniref:Uncharacterized protein n=1 Tax=Dendrobium thyrsiflorum TaxID=117978 RepID=A0ABD0VDR8_DENTH